MTTLREISITFRDASNQANKLDDCASQLRKERYRLESSLQSLRSGWDGEAARLYRAKCQSVMNRLSRMADNLETTASVIRRSARAYYEAERRNLEIIAQNSARSGGTGSAGGGGGMDGR